MAARSLLVNGSYSHGLDKNTEAQTGGGSVKNVFLIRQQLTALGYLEPYVLVGYL